MNLKSSTNHLPISSACNGSMPHVDKPAMPFEQLPSTLTWKQKVAYLGWKMQSIERSECPVTHQFTPGLYIREMRIPKGTMFLGRAHRHGHEVVLTEGSVIWTNPNGRFQIDAPYTHHTSPGDCMVLAAITDVVGHTVHLNPTDSRNIDALEDDIFDSLEQMLSLGRDVEALL